jgi:formiminotetrahydrofolate cyclodeaminase
MVVVWLASLDFSMPTVLEWLKEHYCLPPKGQAFPLKSRERFLMYLDRPLRDYLDELASAQSTPGGGSAAAMSGAMGAALACMVARLTLGKANYADVQPEIEILLERDERFRQRFQQLMQEDIAAYGQLSACFKMPRGSSEEKSARTAAIQQALYSAALVPLEMAELAVELVGDCERIAQIGNVNIISDIATATMMAAAAANGAAWMVHANLGSMRDAVRVVALSERLQIALDAVDAGRLRVASVVEGRTT